MRHLITLIILTTTLQVQAAQYCSDLERRNEAARTGVFLEQFPWQTLTQNNVIFLGEEHGLARPKDLRNVAARLKRTYPKSAKICFFLEFPTSMTVESVRKAYNVPADTEDLARYYAYFPAIIRFAREMRFQLFNVDHPDSKITTLPLNLRDKTMADNIESFFRSGTCEYAVMTIGKAHITPDELDRQTIRAHLQRKNISTATLNIQYANDQLPDPIYSAWNGLCPQKAMPLKKPIIFTNQKIKTLPLHPRESPKMPIGYFDYTVLFPN